MVTIWLIYVVYVSSAIATAAWIADPTFFGRLGKWLISRRRESDSTCCPMCGQSASGATGSSISTGRQE